MDVTRLGERITARESAIGIVGLGYVGLPLVLQFCRGGFKVIGFDVDEKKTLSLNNGKSYIRHINDLDLQKIRDDESFKATTDFGRTAEVDAILICVPTPLTRHMEPDLSFVEATARSIATHLHEGQIVILESTTYPGTTDEVLQHILESRGLKSGKDFLLAYSPEREDPGNTDFATETVPKVVGGCSKEAAEIADLLYSQVFASTCLVSSARTAEAVKLLENIFRSVNIALVNELKQIYGKMGVDIWEVIEAAKTKPFGFMPFYPGPGLGGHCIPIDPFYLSWKAREYNLATRFIELAGQINTAMPEYVISCVTDSLNKRSKSVRGSYILVLGAAYKKDVDDARESPGISLIQLLMQKGARVDYNDPYIPRLPRSRDHDLGMVSVELTAEIVAESDCVLIATDHSCYDYDFLVEHARLVVDTRNATKNVTAGREKIVKA